MSMSLEQRIQEARGANLALYLDDPSPESARLLVTFEKTVERLRRERPQPHEEPWVSPTTSGSYVDYSTLTQTSTPR